MSNSKSPERVAGGRFEITSTIIPELYDTKSQLPINRINNKVQECTLYAKILFTCNQNIADIFHPSCK